MNKRYFILVILILVGITFLTGCNTEALSQDNFPLALEGEYLKIKNDAGVALLNSGIEDVSTFDKEMHLVAYSTKRLTPSKVTFLYADKGTGKVFPLQSIEYEEMYKNDYEYPEILKAKMTLWVLDLIQESQSDSGNIVGVIMNWEQPHFFGGSTFHSVCDFDGDGTWDYCAQDTSWANSIFYTGLTAVEGSRPCRVFNDYNIISIDAIGGITKFQDDYI